MLKQLVEDVRSIKNSFATKDDLKNELKDVVRKDDLKQELDKLHNNVIEDMSDVVNGLFASTDEHKADKSSVRKLEARVATIEDIVLK